MSATNIIRAALDAATVEDAERVQQMIAADIGQRFERPAGDRWNNHGHLSSIGNREHKLLELITNAQDALLERFAHGRYSSDDAVPYETPHEAASALLGDRSWQEIAEMVTSELRESDPPTRKTKRLTPVVRDLGCGMANDYLSQSLLFLGTIHKDKAHWQQGAFGLGGAQTFRHAHAVVIVTRPHPDTDPDEDLITIAVCQWREHEKGKGLYYLVTSDYDLPPGRDLDARPWSAPSSAFPAFEGGTHIALISYEISGYQVATHGAEKSLERVINTRLFKPVTPVRFINRIPKNEAERRFRGLDRQLAERQRKEREVIRDTMPYRINGSTAHLPITCHYFASGKRDEPGAKRTVVAHDHAVLFTSNGQVHKHWSPQELRNRTELRHLYDRVLIVVELDELPIKLRTNLFPPDRSDLMDNEHAQKLERNLIEWLNDPDGDLYELDRELLRQALTSDSNGRPTINIARQIGRALKFKGGFALTGHRGDGTGRRKRRKRKVRQADLYPDPTTLEGPAQIQIEQGATRGLRFHINAEDAFLNSGRGTLQIGCDHPDVGEREITVGQLRKGWVRATIALADGATLGDFTLTASLGGWQKASGGIGPDLGWTTKVKVIEPREDEDRRRRRSSDNPDAEGELVGLAWRGEDDFDDWHAGVPGHVELVEASELATWDEYGDLGNLGVAKIPTIFLNRDYSPLRRYEAARTDLTQDGRDRARDRYAVGAGLGLLLLDRDLKTKSNGAGLSDEVELTAKQAAAQSALVMMPQYDRLATETGIAG